VRAVMAQGRCLGNLLPRQLSFKAALQMLNAFERNCVIAPTAAPASQPLLAGIAQLKRLTA